jgi:hypothetical protein
MARERQNDQLSFVSLAWLPTPRSPPPVHKHSFAQPLNTLQSIAKYPSLSHSSLQSSYIKNEKPLGCKTGVLSINENWPQPQRQLTRQIVQPSPKWSSPTLENPYVAPRECSSRKSDHNTGLMATHLRDWAFSALGYFYWDSFENWNPIPAAKEDRRAIF